MLPFTEACAGLDRMVRDLAAHTGMSIERQYPFAATKLVHKHIEKQIACMASGATTESAYGRGLVRFMGRHFIRGIDPSSLAIR